MKKYVILILFLTLLAIGCFKKDKYELVVYPREGNYANYILVGTYYDVNVARDVADELMQKYPNGEYEIGKNLKRVTPAGLRIYEDTLE